MARWTAPPRLDDRHQGVMAYYPDLTPYRYYPGGSDMLNVGLALAE